MLNLVFVYCLTQISCRVGGRRLTGRKQNNRLRPMEVAQITQLNANNLWLLTVPVFSFFWSFVPDTPDLGREWRAGVSWTHFGRPVPGHPRAPLGAGVKRLIMARDSHSSAVVNNCSGTGIKPPLIQDNCVLQVCLNPSDAWQPMRLGPHS